MMGAFADIGFDFEGLGHMADLGKEKKPAPELPPPLPTPPETSKALIPKWTPLAVGAVGLVIILGILLTSKGKD
jgi:hypothetical protein